MARRRTSVIATPAAAQTDRPRPLGRILVDLVVMRPSDLMSALVLQQQSGAPLGQVCLAEGFVTEAQLMAALSIQTGLARVHLADAPPIPMSPISGLPSSVATTACCLGAGTHRAWWSRPPDPATCGQPRTGSATPVRSRPLWPRNARSRIA
jgi:hypothetical protein